MKRDYLVEVCISCRRASCWHGVSFCDDYHHAGVTKVLASELRKERLESHRYFSADNIRTVTGNEPEWI